MLFSLAVLLACAIDISVSASVDPPRPNSLRPLPKERDQALTRIFFIGDTHADAFCAKEWIRRTGLIDFDSEPWKWTGDENSDALVFLGDYVDKGPTARGVLELIRDVHRAFPDRVVPIIGNHDLFAILDTVLDATARRPMRRAVTKYSYSFVHPQEYIEAGWSPEREDDAELFAAYMGALQLVYQRNLEGKMMVEHVLEHVPPFTENATLKQKVAARLETWEREYAQGLVDSKLAHWLAQLPIVAVVGDALLVHGGVPPDDLKKAVHSFRQSDRDGSAQEALHVKANVKYWVGSFALAYRGHHIFR